MDSIALKYIAYFVKVMIENFQHRDLNVLKLVQNLTLNPHIDHQFDKSD